MTIRESDVVEDDSFDDLVVINSELDDVSDALAVFIRAADGKYFSKSLLFIVILPVPSVR